jgi:hypothetical protein
MCCEYLPATKGNVMRYSHQAGSSWRRGQGTTQDHFSRQKAKRWRIKKIVSHNHFIEDLSKCVVLVMLHADAAHLTQTPR